MTGPEISVVIPTFNRREMCLRAVASAVGQTHTPLEVLVCDDGSTDGTRAAVEELSRDDGRVRYVALPANTGSPAAARNLGVRSARGDWVAFLDDDDEWLAEKLALQAPALADGHMIVCANAFVSRETYFPTSGKVLTFGRRELLRDNPVIISTAVVARRQLLASGGFPEDPRLAAVADHGAWLRLTDLGATGIRPPGRRRELPRQWCGPA